MSSRVDIHISFVHKTVPLYSIPCLSRYVPFLDLSGPEAEQSGYLSIYLGNIYDVLADPNVTRASILFPVA